MRKCIWSDTQKYVQLPASHKIPRGLTQLRADLGPQGTLKSFGEPWSVQGHHHWLEPQGEPFLETEGNTLRAGGRQVRVPKKRVQGPIGDLEEDGSLEEGQAHGGHETPTQRSSSWLLHGTEPCLVHHRHVPTWPHGTESGQCHPGLQWYEGEEGVAVGT